MASLRIEFARSAAKDLRRIDPQWIPRVLAAIEALGGDSCPAGCRKLAGSEHTYRIRVGNYRVIYNIHDDELVVFVEVPGEVAGEVAKLLDALQSGPLSRREAQQALHLRGQANFRDRYCTCFQRSIQPSSR